MEGKELFVYGTDTVLTRVPPEWSGRLQLHWSFQNPNHILLYFFDIKIKVRVLIQVCLIFLLVVHIYTEILEAFIEYMNA